MPLVTTVLFYTYGYVTGHHSLTIDIIIFFLSIVTGQLISLKILITPKELSDSTKYSAIAGLGIMTIGFSLLSYYPPENFIFEHPEGGGYGILDDYGDHDHEHDE